MEESVMSVHQHGGDIYTTSYRLDFSVNLNPLGMPDSVADAACAGVRLSTNYPDVRCQELRSALAQKEGVPAEYIVFGNGAAELIFSQVSAQKPKKALLAAPGFAEYEQALSVHDCEIVYYFLKEENGFQIGSDYLDYLKEDIDIIFLCNPNNPTGVQIERKLLEQILAVCEKRGIRMVLDVCFMDFLDCPQETDFSPALSKNPHLFLLKAFTKTYAMAGLRLGYGLCSDREFMERMEQMCQPWNVSIPAQKAGVAALGETQYVEQAREIIKQERAWLADQLRTLGFQVYDSAANFLFFKGDEQLAKRCGDQGILIRDCSNYQGLERGYYRIAVLTHEANQELIQTLKTLI